jgi:hypothetical protein
VKERRDLFSLEGIKLYPPSPNPFNSSIALRFELSADSELELKIFDISGREVAVLGTEHWALGEHSVVWEAEGMPSGIYIARLSAIGYQLSASGGQSIVQKLLLLK